MIIRTATEADIASIIDFQRQMAKETEGIALPLDVVTQGVRRVFIEPTLGQYYVGENNGQVIGCLLTTYEWSDWRCGTVLWIQSVFVSELHRCQGVYRAMYEHIKQLVKTNPSLCGIRLYVDKSNYNAQKVYRKLGMNGEHYAFYEWMKEGT